MSADDALRFLAMLGIEYAQTFADTKRPVVQETLLMRINAASDVLRTALKDGSNGRPQG